MCLHMVHSCTACTKSDALERVFQPYLDWSNAREMLMPGAATGHDSWFFLSRSTRHVSGLKKDFESGPRMRSSGGQINVSAPGRPTKCTPPGWTPLFPPSDSFAVPKEKTQSAGGTAKTGSRGLTRDGKKCSASDRMRGSSLQTQVHWHAYEHEQRGEPYDTASP